MEKQQRKQVRRRAFYVLEKLSDSDWRCSKHGVYVGHLSRDEYGMWQAFTINGSVRERSGPKGKLLMDTAVNNL